MLSPHGFTLGVTALRTTHTCISLSAQSVAAHKAARRQHEALDLLARQREELLLQLEQHAQHAPTHDPGHEAAGSTGSGRTPAATHGSVGSGQPPGLHQGHVEASGGGVVGGAEADVLQLRQQLKAIEQQAAAVAAAPPAADALTVPELVGTSALAKVVASTATYPHEVGWRPRAASGGGVAGGVKGYLGFQGMRRGWQEYLPTTAVGRIVVSGPSVRRVTWRRRKRNFLVGR